jgi:PUA domain protein
MRVFTLSKRESREVVGKIEQTWPFMPILGKNETARVAEIEGDRRLLIFPSWMAIDLDGRILPFLGSQELLRSFPAVVVDTGAISHICKGADVMRPGILTVEGEFHAGGIVCVKEQRYQKFIAVGEALLAGGDALAASKGAVVRNMHYVGDLYWESAKSMGKVA